MSVIPVADGLQTFLKKNKLLNFSLFKKEKNIGKIINDSWVILYKQNSLEIARLGITIRKKYIKKATTRNYWKRQIKEQFRTKQVKLNNYDFVFIARKAINSKEENVLKKELNQQWVKLITILEKQPFLP